MLVEKLFSSFFNPVISLNIYYDQYEKCGHIFFPALGFRENGGHIRFYGTHQGTYNFKTPSSNGVKSCIHIEEIYMKKRTEPFFSFAEY